MTKTVTIPTARAADGELQERRVNVVRARLVLMAQRLLLFGAMIALWEVSVRMGWIDPYFTSQPSEILKRLVEWAKDGSLVQHVPITIFEAALGFVLGTLAGGVAHRLDLLGEFGAEAVVGQADDAHAMYGAFDLPQ